MQSTIPHYASADDTKSAVLLAFADTDFYPDEYDAPGATSMDGVVSYIGPDGTAWSTVRNAPIGTGVSDTGAHFRISTRKCSSANMSRGITDFDTSSLGAGAQHMVTIIPFTSQQRAARFPHTLLINATKANGLDSPSILLVYQLGGIDKRRLLHKLGTLEKGTMSAVEGGLKKYLHLS